MAKSASRRLPVKVFVKAAHLQEKEDMPRKQAIATAASMNRAGRLTEGGEYIRARRKG